MQTRLEGKEGRGGFEQHFTVAGHDAKISEFSSYKQQQTSDITTIQ